ncbi:Alginate lyase [Desulfovibrio sp. X2]|uniref:alginate lyase family protein n=1 Tax=Desulfovibrio sp. X2 TaxID=941449 RepID=UPI000358AC33|nr:alginate lyase family protein [Desulfovibrio sp. X2]EPR37403.1 Alginate lyase [Desulfovibrio sp. X2]
MPRFATTFLASFLLVLLVLLAGAFCVAAEPPATISLPPLSLAAARAALLAGRGPRAAYEALLEDADRALRAGPYSVVDKQKTPPSGDKHDYMSVGPYRWPDPASPNGLPWIVRDGKTNPESRGEGYDSARLGRMSYAVSTLALAWYLGGNDAYADRAAVLLRAWFLDPATRMNPDFDYAQGVPGGARGTKSGIIDSRLFIPVVDAARLLAGSSFWTPEDEAGLRAWFSAFLDWLLDSPLGREEAEATNNHGMWYDAQVAAMALYTGRTDVARRVLGTSAPERLAAQIAPDGSLPLELSRTKSLRYTLFTLQAAFALADMGRSVGVDLWHFHTPDGRSLREAFDYVASWAGNPASWPYSEIVPVDPKAFVSLFLCAAQGFGDPGLASGIALIDPDDWRTDRGRLLYFPPDKAPPERRRAIPAP